MLADLAPKRFINGQWFNGSEFLGSTFNCTSGKLTQWTPSITGTVDLAGGFVVPPFADAHNHFPGGERDFVERNRAHLQAGVFYTLNPGGNAEIANPIRPRLGTSAAIDAIFAHGVFTGSGGHPGPLLEYFSDCDELSFDKAKLKDHYFHAVDSVADLDEVWPQFLSTNPEFVKIILGFSGAHRSHGQRSLDLHPEIAKEIVPRAQSAGLRTGAHIENAEDFHCALEAHIDLVCTCQFFRSRTAGRALTPKRSPNQTSISSRLQTHD